MPLYEAYGLKLASALSLPELLGAEGGADVFLDMREPQCAAPDEGSPIVCASASPHRAHLTWGAAGDLLVEDGRRITVTPYRESDMAAVRLFVLGAGLGVLLHQRGLLVFHASGVAIAGGVVGFLGAKGWGKSTMAATLHQIGHPLISDELLAMRFDGEGQPWVLPGSPQLRIWSDVFEGTGGNPDAGVRVRPGVDKFSISATSTALAPLVFRCAYLLGSGPEASIQPVDRGRAFLELASHLYVSRFGTSFMQATGATRVFQQINSLLRMTPVKRLLRRRDLGELREVARLVERDACRQPACAVS